MTSVRAAWAVPVVLVALSLTACSGDDDEPSDSPSEAAPTEVAKLSDIPDAVLVIKPGSPDAPQAYRTAEITHVGGEPGARSVSVDYQSGPDLCSMFTGYATQESDSAIDVTVIVGEQPGCTGDPTTRTTVLNLDAPVGDRKLEVSRYSQQSLPIDNPKA